jgi:hypothetical protein
MDVDVIARLRRENPVADVRPVDEAALFRRIVTGGRTELAVGSELQPTPGRRARWSSRRLLLASLAILCVAAPIALAAHRSGLLNFAFGQTPPKYVSRLLDSFPPPAYRAGGASPQFANRNNIVHGSERMVAAITTNSGVVARMYAVNLRTGGVCFVALGGPFNGGGCTVGRPNQRHAFGPASIGSWGRPGESRFGNRVTLAGRATAARAASIVVHYRDGLAGGVPLSHNWFMYEVPEEHELWGHEPISMDVLDASNRVLAVEIDPLDLKYQHRIKAERPLLPASVVAREALPWKGAYVKLEWAKGDQGNPCMRALNTGDPVQTRNWLCGPAVARTTPYANKPHEPVYFELRRFASHGRAGGYVYAIGWVGAPVTRLEVRFQDSTTLRIPLRRGLFLYVIDSQHWHLGSRPSYLVGRDRRGKVVYRHSLGPREPCSYPVADKTCAQIVVHNG